MTTAYESWEVKQVWRAALEIRLCPPREALFAASPDEFVQRHVRGCFACRERLAEGPDSPWSELGQALREHFSAPAAPVPAPGQLWRLSPDLADWRQREPGRVPALAHYNPPLVLLLAVEAPFEGFLVVQTYFDDALAGPGDVDLGGERGFAQPWNAFQVRTAHLAAYAGDVSAETLAEAQTAVRQWAEETPTGAPVAAAIPGQASSTDSPSPDQAEAQTENWADEDDAPPAGVAALAESDPRSYFRAMELEVGAFFAARSAAAQSSTPAVRRPKLPVSMEDFLRRKYPGRSYRNLSGEPLAALATLEHPANELPLAADDRGGRVLVNILAGQGEDLAVMPALAEITASATDEQDLVVQGRVPNAPSRLTWIMAWTRTAEDDLLEACETEFLEGGFFHLRFTGQTPKALEKGGLYAVVWGDAEA